MWVHVFRFGHWEQSGHQLHGIRITGAMAPHQRVENAEAIKTIKDHHRLFKITTPIKVNILENYLKMHPNQDFVRSVATALREGFWPCADTCPEEGFPITWDNTRTNP